jgi:hypothetical protein
LIEHKELPSEYVSIRQVWLQNISRCSEAISNRAKPDVSEQGDWQEIGNRTIVYSVSALHHSLVDFGEATVRKDVRRYYDKQYSPEVNHIWKLWEGNITKEYVRKKYPDLKHDWNVETKVEELQKKKPSAGWCWKKNADQSILLFDYIIQTLNKYGMLFESQPKGYSNVEMKSA